MPILTQPANTTTLSDSCPTCGGTGAYTLGWNDLSAYGAVLVRAIANGGHLTGELPEQGSNPSVRTMALYRLVELGLITRTRAASGQGFYHDLTPRGLALARSARPKEATQWTR